MTFIPLDQTVNVDEVSAALGDSAARLAVYLMKLRAVGLRDSQVRSAIQRIFTLRNESTQPNARDKLADGRIIAAQELSLDLETTANILWSAADECDGMTDMQIAQLFDDVRPYIRNPEPSAMNRKPERG
jgi:hypothetical protein